MMKKICIWKVWMKLLNSVNYYEGLVLLICQLWLEQISEMWKGIFSSISQVWMLLKKYLCCIGVLFI